MVCLPLEQDLLLSEEARVVGLWRLQRLLLSDRRLRAWTVLFGSAVAGLIVARRRIERGRVNGV